MDFKLAPLEPGKAYHVRGDLQVRAARLLFEREDRQPDEL